MALDFKLGDFFYAHRGLWRNEGPPENSLAAFRAAAANGFGIELDIQLSADERAICFHDKSLDRMTGQKANLAELSTEHLVAINLLDTEEKIPTLEDVLSIWPINLPALFELKASPSNAEKLAQTVERQILTSDRHATIMSFEPKAVAALSANVTRGLLIEARHLSSDRDFLASVEIGRELDVDYFSIWHADAEFARSTAAIGESELVVWTVKSEVEYQTAHPFCKAQIFEGFDPRAIAPNDKADMS